MVQTIISEIESDKKSSSRKGRLALVGIGPGNPLDRTHRAESAIAESDVVIGYARYIFSISDLTAGKEVIASGMKEEVDRCKLAIERAKSGASVALISSGDPGIYGMAGLVLELIGESKSEISIEIIPGVSAANAAAAKLGAPLMLDFASISLSDLLISWDEIARRLDAVAAADLVVALYNPRSQTRVKQLERAAEIFRKYRPVSTPVGIVSAIGSEEENIVLSNLGVFLGEEIGMRSIVIVGNSTSRAEGGWLITPRGYRL